MRTVVTLLLLTPWAGARDWDFDTLAGRIETRLNARRVSIPLMGLVGFAANIARPVGVKDFQLAILERVDRDRIESAGLEEIAPGWRPVVRVRSHREHTAIYARDEGNWTRMLVLAVDGRDATLVQFQLRPTQLLTFLAERARGPN